MSRRYGFEDFLYLVGRLRDPETGCPWDIKQNYRSIVPHTLEEVYEVVEAIEREDFLNLREELGDLLLQISLYSQFAKEESRFDLHDVIHHLVAKLIRRHPHVFPDGTLESRVDTQDGVSPQQALHNWNEIKAAEKAARLAEQGDEGETKQDQTLTSILGDIPKAMPAMRRALKLQQRAAKIGFDWDSIKRVFEKLDEELGELQYELNQSELDQEKIESEVGDLLFVCVNIARHLKVDPESALRLTNRKFEERFHYMERTVASDNRNITDYGLEELENLWQKAKLELAEPTE